MSRCRSCVPLSVEVRRAADLLERRWLLQVLLAAHSGAVRFNEFAETIEGISTRMLGERLRDLEAAGLMRRIVIPARPPAVEYRLTDRGRALVPLLDALSYFAAAAAVLSGV
jgi:DNA-binding HxlR family transcriptional regulator